MHRSIVSHSVPALAAMVLGTANAVALAQAPSSPPAPATAMNFQQVVERVVTQGYNDVREVERKSDKLYEIKARNSKGRLVELYVDARSGDILREEVKQ